MDSKLKDNLIQAVSARKTLLRDDTGTSGIGYPDSATIAAYRNVFINDPQGQIVLKDLLQILRFSEKGSDMYHLAMRNVGLEILTRCGIGVDDLVETIIKGL